MLSEDGKTAYLNVIGLTHDDLEGLLAGTIKMVPLATGEKVFLIPGATRDEIAENAREFFSQLAPEKSISVHRTDETRN